MRGAGEYGPGSPDNPATGEVICGVAIQTFLPRKILVTGASGFVGQFLLEKLVSSAQTGTTIVALHNHGLDPVLEGRFGDRVVWIKGDIAADDLSEAAAGVDTVFHLAAYSTTSEADDERRRLARVNVLGTRRLATACKESGARHFIFVSSIAACEAATVPEIDEESGVPVSAYGRSKKAAEQLLMEMAGNGFEVTVLRPTALFGENHLGSVYELAKLIDQGRFFLFGRGNGQTNFYYIRDFVDVLSAVQHDPRTFGQTFIAADESIALRELAFLIGAEIELRRNVPSIPYSLGFCVAAACDVASKIVGRPLPLSMRRFRAMTGNTSYSSRKLKEVLGIFPAFGTREGLRKAVAWYRLAELIGARS